LIVEEMKVYHFKSDSTTFWRITWLNKCTALLNMPTRDLESSGREQMGGVYKAFDIQKHRRTTRPSPVIIGLPLLQALHYYRRTLKEDRLKDSLQIIFILVFTFHELSATSVSSTSFNII
jgi:hypothetical protein